MKRFSLNFTTVRKMLPVAGVVIALAGYASGAKADTLTTFTGGDNSVSNFAQMTNSRAAEASFAAAAPGLSVLTFESALPSGVSISGGAVTNNLSCGAVCGFDTTSGGSFYYYLFNGNTATFTFTAPINAFGMYITGLQTDVVPNETLTFSDGSSEVILAPSAVNGGGAFIGFTDIGASIVSVSYNAGNDIVALDDVQYGTVGSTSPTPEPSTLVLLGTGLVGAFGAFRRRFANS